MFETRLCEQKYPGENKTAQVVEHYTRQGWLFGELSPCELFQRIRWVGSRVGGEAL
jgi:hypothetical protein